VSQKLLDCVTDFLTAPVDLAHAPDVPKGEIWWEERGGWLYPWRMVGPHSGYPCGEPRKKEDGK